MFRRLVTLLQSPGARPAISVSAPSVIEQCDEKPRDIIASDAEKAQATSPLTVEVVDGHLHKRRLDVWLDKVVHWSGSPAFFIFTVAGLIAWAGLGIAGYRCALRFSTPADTTATTPTGTSSSPTSKPSAHVRANCSAPR